MARRDFSVRCDCVGGCSVLMVGDWDWGDEDDFVCLDLYEHVSYQRGFRDRVRVAWAVLLGRQPYTHGLVLYEPGVRALRDHLTVALGEVGAQREKSPLNRPVLVPRADGDGTLVQAVAVAPSMVFAALDAEQCAVLAQHNFGASQAGCPTRAKTQEGRTDAS